jgi:hypothetical protein
MSRVVRFRVRLVVVCFTAEVLRYMRVFIECIEFYFANKVMQ